MKKYTSPDLTELTLEPKDVITLSSGTNGNAVEFDYNDFSFGYHA